MKARLTCGRAIRHAWILYNNVDRVPDMTQTEKERLKAEAKMLVGYLLCTHVAAIMVDSHCR